MKVRLGQVLGMLAGLHAGCAPVSEAFHGDAAEDDDSSAIGDDDSGSADDDDSAQIGPCPPGMIHVEGGTFDLGEWDPEQAIGYNNDGIIMLSTFDADGFCVDEYPFPGSVGEPWPWDGLSVEDAMVFEALVTPYGRRLCGMVELMLAGAGPENWRFPYDPEERISGMCEPDDFDPGPLGNYPTCVSPLGVHDFMVRSTWGRLHSDELREACGEAYLGGVEDLPGGGDFAVWGGTSRPDTWYASTNFGIHFHFLGAGSHSDDGVRTCATPGTPHDTAAWNDLLDEFRESYSFATLLYGAPPPGLSSRDQRTD